MKTSIVITSDDSILKTLNFKPYRSKVERRVIPFMPMPNEDQFMDIKTPWGAVLTAKSGDFYLAKGVQGEVWAYPKDKIEKVMMPAD